MISCGAPAFRRDEAKTRWYHTPMSQKARFRAIASLILITALSPTLPAREPAEELIAGVHIFGPAERMEVEATMSISEGAAGQDRRLRGWYEREEDAFSIFVEVIHPPFLRNMKFLLSRDGGREESWMRTSRGVRRLGTSDGGERVFGSHFTARDFSRIDPGESEINYVEPPEGGEAVIDVKDEGRSRRRFYIDVESRLIRRIEFFDAAGRRIKEYELLEVEQESGRPVPKRAVMRELDGSGETEITLTEVGFPSSIPRRYFSRGNL